MSKGLSEAALSPAPVLPSDKLATSWGGLKAH